MTATAKPRKASTPRKAARRPQVANGEVTANGHAPVVDEPRPPEEFVVTEPVEPVEPVIKHPYGEREVYIYQPKGADALGNPFPPIVFPHVLTLTPTPKFFWKIYPLNEMYQAFEWMIFAKVPRDIQEQVMDLGERDMVEQAEFFKGWFAPISRPQGGPKPPGEF